jgi:arabinogalactan endo-1,4-beta-galactosidase
MDVMISPGKGLLAALLVLTAATAAGAADFALGADISWMDQMEASGKVFKDSTGKTADLLDILKQYGVSSIRLRVWVNPAGGWCGKSDVVKMAKRAQGKGMRLMVDFHYSDSWADPGQQTKPAAWAAYTQDQLVQAVATHTKDVLTTLKDSGIVPEWVQVGNETNDGMLWPANAGDPGGRITVSGAAKFAALVQSGSQAVKAVAPSALVVVHIANGWDNGLFRWVFDSLKAKGASWDVVGMSLYPDSSNWRTYASQALTNMKDMVSRYGKKVVVSEVGFAMSQSDTAYQLLKLLVSNTKSVSGNSGLGVFYWEPEAYYGWQGYQLSAFDDAGKPTKALKAFQEARSTAVEKPIPFSDPNGAGWLILADGVVWTGTRSTDFLVTDLTGKIAARGTARPGLPVGPLGTGTWIIHSRNGSELRMIP